MSESRTTRVGRIEFAVDWPPGHVAAYLLDGDEPVLVDAGMPDGEGVLVDALAGYGYGPADVEHLVVTHPHVDHVGQARAVVEAGDPTVYAPAGVRERFARDSEDLAARVRANADEAGLTGDARAEAVEMAVDSLERDRALLPADAVDVWVEGGDRVAVGTHTFEAVHAPGHQADHLCFAADVEGERALLSGDMVIEPFRAVALHDGLDDGYREAFAAFSAALDRLERLEVDRVYPGHGPVHTRHSGTVERDRRSLQHRLDAVAAAVADGRRTVPELTAAIAGDGGRGARYVLMEVVAAAAHLETEGRLGSAVEDGVRHYYPADE